MIKTDMQNDCKLISVIVILKQIKFIKTFLHISAHEMNEYVSYVRMNMFPILIIQS